MAAHARYFNPGLRGLLRGFIFILVIVLTLTLLPWVLRKQLKILEHTSNTEVWYLTHPNITSYLSFNSETKCKYCRNATRICQNNILLDDERDNEVAYFISSYIQNKNQRHAIRRTWGSSTRMPPVFVMGIHPDKAKMVSATREAEEYGDMIIEDFADAFENATLKTAGILKHFMRFCKNVNYLMKTEDDVFVNTKVVENIARRHLNATRESSRIIGYIHYEARVVRNIRSPWYVGYATHHNRKYPTYASRLGYLLPGSRVKEILEKSVDIPIIPVEDAYFTGLVASAIGLHHTMDAKFNAQAVVTSNYCTVKSQSVVQAPDPVAMDKLWSSLILKRPFKCFTFWNKFMSGIFA